MTDRLESAIVFPCQADALIGVLHRPVGGESSIGVLIVVGGPQYRVGSHRQFVLMARWLATAGYAALRFDYRGMGDATGAARTFEEIDDDIRCAIDVLMREQPALTGIVLLGLCDAASAALMYCRLDPRLAGLILLNPWARTEVGQARAVVRHYYGHRLFQRSLWAKILSGEFDARAAFLDLVRFARRSQRSQAKEEAANRPGFLVRMEQGMASFRKPVLVLLSGRDLTAREFEDYCRRSNRRKRWLASRFVVLSKLSEADHTFSSASVLKAACATIVTWLRRLPDERAGPRGPE